MDELESLSHTKWECKYHVVFIPKCRRRTLYVELRRHLGGGVPKACSAEGIADRRGPSDAGPRAYDDLDPTKICGVSGGGHIKGKSAIYLARTYGERKRGFVGQHFWARGYYVSTVGRDEQAIREYITNQEQEDKRLEQLNLWR